VPCPASPDIYIGFSPHVRFMRLFYVLSGSFGYIILIFYSLAFSINPPADLPLLLLLPLFLLERDRSMSSDALELEILAGYCLRIPSFFFFSFFLRSCFTRTLIASFSCFLTLLPSVIPPPVFRWGKVPFFYYHISSIFP